MGHKKPKNVPGGEWGGGGDGGGCGGGGGEVGGKKKTRREVRIIKISKNQRNDPGYSGIPNLK